MRMLRKTLLTVSGAIALLALLVAFNTLRLPSRQLAVAPLKPLELDQDAAARRLSGAVQIKTITYDHQPDASAPAFLQFHDYLAQQFPLTHQLLKREIVSKYSLLFTWQGSDPSAKPILLMAHQDVVPIAPSTEKDWQHEPFGGAIKDGFIWGRGSWDDKGNLVAIMEAVELLAARGFQPKQTIYLAFGHDEEAGVHAGQAGAKQIAALLQSRGVKLDFVLDEGLLVTQGVVKGLDSPVALIGVAEKGYLTLNLRTQTPPGHSSSPPLRTAIGSMSAALAQLEKQQMPAAVRDTAAEMFASLAPEIKGINRVLLSNLWLFGPLVRQQLEQQPSANAMLRTTTALTLVHAGNKENVLPGVAEATVNFRMLPGDSQQDVVAHTKRAIGDAAIHVHAGSLGWDASRISRTDSAAYAQLNRTIREVFPQAIVAPGLLVAATDSRHMAELADNIYRFSPVRARGEDLARFHGTNERISVSNYAEMIRFYHRLLSNMSGA